ncbi:methyltransferase, partial [bacterium]|nr:methyltransferase [bacterium]
DTIARTVVEPSSDLSSRLKMVMEGDGVRLLQERFEDLHIANKYNAIVMNPPFGQGGKTAIEHLAKATQHLRDGGRVVALIPVGPSADKRFDTWFTDEKEGKDLYMAADIRLPSVTFERAGTSVATRVVVIEKQTNQKLAESIRKVSRDYSSADTIKEFFERIENAEIPPRAKKDVGVTNEVPTAQGEVAKYRTNAPEVTHTTRKGTVIRGVIAKDLSKEEAEAIDPYTWKKDGGYFIRSRHVERDDDGVSMLKRSASQETGAKTSPAMSVGEVERIVGEVVNGLTVPADAVIVYRSESDLPQEIQEQAKRENATGKVDAVYWKGKVHVVAGKMLNALHVEEALAHESTHAGARLLFGKEMKPFFTRLYRALRPSGVRAVLEKHGIDMEEYFKTAKEMTYEERAVFLIDEMLAHLGQKQVLEDLPGRVKRAWQELWGAFRHLLRKAGYKRLADGSESDLLYLVKRMREQAAKNERATAEGRAAFMVAWHGTPHVWQPEPGFPHGRPRLDKMGAGEGNQAFGWGWYSAEERSVADEYQGKLAKKTIVFANKIPETVLEKEIQALLEKAIRPMQYGYAWGEANRIYDRLVDPYLKKDSTEKNKYGYPVGTVPLDADELSRKIGLRDAALALGKPDISYSGSLYQLDIPDEVLPFLLDWDKPLSEQTPEVRKALEKGLAESDLPNMARNNPTGEQMYNSLGLAQGSRGGKGSNAQIQKAESEYLARLGIVGNRYLDGQSRDDGEGSYNFVLWDQNTLDKVALLERNGEKLDAIRNDAAFMRGSDTITMDGVERGEIRFSRGSMQQEPLDNEVLSRLGLTGKQRKTLSQRISEIIHKDWRDLASEWKERANEGLFDGLAGIAQAERDAGITDFSKRGYVGARLATGVADVMHGILNFGGVKWQDGVLQGKEGTRGLLEILGDLEGDLDAWLGWMGGNRGAELKAQGRENNLSLDDINYLKSLNKGKEEAFNKAKAEYNALNSAMLDLAEGAGTITSSSRKQWESEWYVPFYRAAEADADAALLGPKTKRGLS